jgi:hypothetical protein
VLYRRWHLINYAITLSTGLRPADLPGDRAAVPGRHHQPAARQIHRRLFVLAIFALIGSFVFLLREIFIASSWMRSHRHVRQPRPEN